MSLLAILGRMRGAALALLLGLAGVACGSAGAGSSSDQDASRARPALSIVSLDPLTVRGKGFVARERVKLLVGATAPKTRSARADARGRFTANLGIKAAGRCASVAVQAIGSRGSRAFVDVTGPDCAPLGSPPGKG
jgi:hypothetical protein